MLFVGGVVAMHIVNIDTWNKHARYSEEPISNGRLLAACAPFSYANGSCVGFVCFTGVILSYTACILSIDEQQARLFLSLPLCVYVFSCVCVCVCHSLIYKSHRKRLHINLIYPFHLKAN